MQQTETFHADYEEPRRSLREYLAIFNRRRTLIVLVTLAITAAAAAYAFTLPKVFTARVKFLPPQQQSGLLSAAMMQGALAAIGGDILGESKTAKLYVEMLKVESVRDPLIDRFKLQEVYKKEFREDVYKTLNRVINVTSGKEGIITVTVDDTDPKRAAEMANGIVDELKSLTTHMSMSGATNSKGYLEERLAAAREELTAAENGIKAFQGKYKTVDATQQAALSVNATAQLSAQLTAQEIELSVVRRTYADTSQQVKTLQQSIGALRGKISALQSGSGTSALPGFEHIPERGQEYLHLMRRFKTAETVYEMLLKQYEVAKLNADNDVSSIQVIQKALVPQRKSKPARLNMVLEGFLAGAVLSLFLAVFLENLSRTPREAGR